MRLWALHLRRSSQSAQIEATHLYTKVLEKICQPSKKMETVDVEASRIT